MNYLICIDYEDPLEGLSQTRYIAIEAENLVLAMHEAESYRDEAIAIHLMDMVDTYSGDMFSSEKYTSLMMLENQGNAWRISKTLRTVYRIWLKGRKNHCQYAEG